MFRCGAARIVAIHVQEAAPTCMAVATPATSRYVLFHPTSSFVIPLQDLAHQNGRRRTCAAAVLVSALLVS